MTTINLTATMHQPPSREQYFTEHLLSSPSQHGYPQRPLTTGHHPLDESNQVMLSSSMSSLTGGGVCQNPTYQLQQQGGPPSAFNLETQSNSVTATRIGENPQEDRSHQAPNMSSRPVVKRYVTLQTEESTSAVQSEQPSASVSSKRSPTQDGTSASKSATNQLDSAGRTPGQDGERRCLTSAKLEEAAAGGAIMPYRTLDDGSRDKK